MARFSLGGGEDDEAREAPGSSSSGQGSKRRRTTQQPSPPSPQPSQPPPPNDGTEPFLVEPEPEDQIEPQEEEEDAEAESDHEEAEGEEEEEHDREVDGLLENQPQPDSNEDPFEPLNLTLIDPEVFDCPICLEPLSSPVFQCENGHVACSSCCVKIHNKCPTCGWPTGYNRCRAIEKVIEVVRIACRYTSYGCRWILNYSNKFVHETTCSFGPCSCPLSYCTYTGPAFSFYSHFGRSHPHAAKNFFFNKFFSVSMEITQKFVVLRESNETSIFVLGLYTEYNGSKFNIVRIASSSVPSSRLSYHLTAKHEDTSVTLRSPVESIKTWSESAPLRKYILVPGHYISSTGQFHLDICIWKHEEGVTPTPVV